VAKPAWKKYEQEVLELIKDWAGDGAKIEYDVKLPGRDSGRKRQIDILVIGTFGDGLLEGLTIAIDCKCYGKKINVGHADKFVGLIEDVQTDFGILITNKGWSPAAEKRLPRAMSIRRIEDRPALAMAFIDALPELLYDVDFAEDDYYSGTFWDLEPHGGIGAAIAYNYVERQSRRPIDHPDELDWLDETLATGRLSELNWSDKTECAHAAEIVLTHYLGRVPLREELDSFVLEIASKWIDGQEWTVELGDIERQTGLWANIGGSPGET
jgi:hypothetical protein